MQLTASDQRSIQGEKFQAHSQLQHDSSLDDISSQLVQSACLTAGPETLARPEKSIPATAAVLPGASGAAARLSELQALAAELDPHHEAMAASHTVAALLTMASHSLPPASTTDQQQASAMPESTADIGVQSALVPPLQNAPGPAPDLPQPPALSLTTNSAQPFAGQSRIIFAHSAQAAIKPSRVQHRAVRRSGIEPFCNLPTGLTSNTLGEPVRIHWWYAD